MVQQDVLFNPSTLQPAVESCGIRRSDRSRSRLIQGSGHQWRWLDRFWGKASSSPWDPLGSSGSFEVFLYWSSSYSSSFFWIYIILYHFIPISTRCNLTLNAGEDSGCSPDGHGRSSWPWCGATMPRPRVWCPHSCDVRCVAIQNTQVPKDPHFCNPSVPFQSGTSNSRKF